MASTNKYRFNILDGSGYRIAVANFNAEEKISAPYTLTLSLVSEDQITLDEVIKSEALLTITGKDVDRYFHGHICNFAMAGRIDRFFTYNATVVPYVWFMNLNKNFRIFQNMTAVDIAKKLLDENRIASDEYEFKLKSDYQKRRYCTQYGESDFRFMCRILEEEGIFFFFEHTEDSHTIIFSDTEEIYDPIEGESEMIFNNDSNMVAEKETIRDFSCNRAICPGKITHTNYNFKRPSLDMKLNEEGETHAEHELFEYPGDYGLPPEGSPKVRNHLEHVKSLEVTMQGNGNCSRFLPGFTFSVSDHPFDELNDEYCLAAVTHHGSQSGVFGEHGGIGGDYTYANSFIAIPSKTVYRTGQAIEKPYVKGLQSAVVTGPPGEEIHTDEYGRIKVQFHWDREGKKDEKSSCWLRTSQPWSGNGWGMVSLPRVGDEVLVDFINGDPDWPIMVGNVNNAESPALYPLPANKTQSGIKSRSYPKGSPDNFNELRFDDAKGAEEIYLQSEKDWNILVKNRKGETVGGESSTVVGKNCDLYVGGDSFTIIKGKSTELAKEIVIGADDIVTIVSGASSIVISPEGIKINSPKVDINDGSKAPKPAEQPVSGCTGKGGGFGGGGASGGWDSGVCKFTSGGSTSKSGKSSSLVDSTSPAAPTESKAIMDTAVPPGEEIPLNQFTGTVPSGGWAGASSDNGTPADDVWKIGPVTDSASGLGDLISSASTSPLLKGAGLPGAGDLVSSASSSIPGGLQKSFAAVSPGMDTATVLKDAAINEGRSSIAQELDKAKGKLLEQTGIARAQTEAEQEMGKLKSLLKSPKVDKDTLVKKF